MAIEWESTQHRRLPVYLMLDCSAGMAGAKIQQLDAAVRMFYEMLMSEPVARERVWISIITFASNAQIHDLMPIMEFTPPFLIAGGSAALGSALHLLNESLDQDLIPNQLTRKGDFKPLVFIFADGVPTDAWESEAQRLISRTQFRPARIVAFAVGSDADIALLNQIADDVFRLEDMTPDILRAFFRWP